MRHATRIYPVRGWWWPVVMGAAGVGVTLFGTRELRRAFHVRENPALSFVSEPSPETVVVSLAAGITLLLFAALGAWRNWRAFVVTDEALWERAWPARSRRIGWDEIRHVSLAHDGASLDSYHGEIPIGRELARWRQLVAQIEARVPPAPAAEPLGDGDMQQWLGAEPLRLWGLRPLRKTAAPFCVAGVVAGALVGLIAGLGTYQESGVWPVVHALFGAVAGFVVGLLPAIVASLPLRVFVDEHGFELVGASGRRVRRRWHTVQRLDHGRFAWRLHTNEEMLHFVKRPRSSQRLLRLVVQVLLARQQGRVPDTAVDVADAALSRAGMTDAAADRGLSRDITAA